MDDLAESAKHALDFLSVATAIGTLVGALPVIAAILSILWTGLRIYECKTVQAWLREDDE